MGVDCGAGEDLFLERVAFGDGIRLPRSVWEDMVFRCCSECAE